jgi:hypothetical protein
VEAVFAAQAASSRVERSSGARSECRLQKSVRGIFPAWSRWAARHIKTKSDRAAWRVFPRQRGAYLRRLKGCWA